MNVRLRSTAIATGLLAISLIAGCSSSDDSVQTPSSTSTVSADSTAASTTGSAVESSSVLPSEAATDPNTSVPETSDVPPPANTPVPAPGGGDVNQTVPEGELTTQAPVELNQTGDFGNGVTVQLTGIEPITTTAQLPGEVAGPGLKITVLFTNNSTAPISLDTAIVDLSDSIDTPALPMSASPAAPVSGELPAGQTATGVYVFTVPSGFENPATIRVTYTTAAPIVIFVGNPQ